MASGLPPQAPARKIAYLFSTFPHLSTTFLQREVRGLQKAGLSPLLAANRPPPAGMFHPGDADFAVETIYLNPIRLPAYIKANVRRLLRDPMRYARAVMLALKATDAFPRQRFRNLARLAGAAFLAEYLEARHVEHVHAHFAFGAAGVAFLLEALCGIPYSVSIHGSDVLLPQPLTLEKLRRARFIVSNCRYHIAYLRKRFPVLRDKRFYVVPLGISCKASPWDTVIPPGPLPPLRILNVARLDPVKGHATLINACGRLRNAGVPFVCRLVGDGPEKAAIAQMINQQGLADYIEMTGPLYEQAVARQFDWCHVMVLASESEGTPMTVIEAMAKGRPVVAPEITGLPEMVLQGETGLLYPKGNPQALAENLARLFRAPERLKEMGAAGRRRALDMYDAEQNARQLAAIFAKEVGS